MVLFTKPKFSFTILLKSLLIGITICTQLNPLQAQETNTDNHIKEVYAKIQSNQTRNYLFPSNVNCPKPMMGWTAFNNEFLRKHPDANAELLDNGRLLALVLIQTNKSNKVTLLGFVDHNKPNQAIINQLREEFTAAAFLGYKSQIDGKPNKEKPLVFYYSLVGNPNLPRTHTTSTVAKNEMIIPDTSLIFNPNDTAGTIDIKEANQVRAIDKNALKEARFLGGQQLFIYHIMNNFVYPTRCQDLEINGYVILKFRVNRTGNIDKITVIQETSKCSEFTAEAIRVLKLSPIWIPGTNNGKNISTWFQVPIRLSLQ